MQLRKRVVAAIHAAILPRGSKLPSSRKLSLELGISRNTVSIAYHHLIAEGHLITRERSGVYVADEAVARPSLPRDGGRIASPSMTSEASLAARSIHARLSDTHGYRCPTDWQAYPYPFIDGRYDRSLFPVAEWREASRLALAVKEIDQWSIDNVDADDELLIEEIRTKLLPRRGISAQPNEILITAGEQQALHLLTALFASTDVSFGIEDPGLPAMRELVSLAGAQIVPLPIDRSGLIVGEALSGCGLAYVTPSRQRPTGVTMSRARREELVAAARERDLLIIEDDFECEMNYLREALPALRSMDSDRVLYVASLSKLLAPGIRLGFLVAPPEIIAKARKLRELTTKRPSPNNQRTAAHFISLGHYDAMLARLNRVCEDRLIALRDALNHYRPQSITIPAVDGGTAYWVEGPESLDASLLAEIAERRGILIEPVQEYFLDSADHANVFRLGITGIRREEIRPGVEQLCAIMRNLSANQASEPASEGRWLTQRELEQVLPGATLLYKTVYGDPCTIELMPDGSLRGRAGQTDEETDTGRWWIEGDRWFRQWDSWAYGEPSGFHIRLEDILLKWLNGEGKVVDTAILSMPGTQLANQNWPH
ncbi:MAG TPA: PLP-dependent aminotransferase family protein [Sphingomonadaceae bacterium]|nr:PLP-dependent aminotransferase family protein [Sphingomonadaceae bacterium]